MADASKQGEQARQRNHYEKTTSLRRPSVATQVFSCGVHKDCPFKEWHLYPHTVIGRWWTCDTTTMDTTGRYESMLLQVLRNYYTSNPSGRVPQNLDRTRGGRQ